MLHFNENKVTIKIYLTGTNYIDLCTFYA
jgi:hypothetical protein